MFGMPMVTNDLAEDSLPLIASFMGVPPHITELQVRWQTDRANGVRTVQRIMLQTYAEVRNMKDALKQPSQAC